MYLDAFKKTVYLRYRHFLKTTQTYRIKMLFKLYDNKQENEFAPERSQNGEHVFQMVKILYFVFEKNNLDGTKRDRSTTPVPVTRIGQGQVEEIPEETNATHFMTMRKHI